MNSYSWPINRTLTGTNTSSYSGPGSNGNEVSNFPQNTRTWTSPSDADGGVLPLYRRSDGIILILDRNTWNHLTVCKQIIIIIIIIIILSIWEFFISTLAHGFAWETASLRKPPELSLVF